MDIFGNPNIGSAARLAEINRQWKKNEFIHSLDPNFGYETIGTYDQAFEKNNIKGSWFTCPEVGTADSITAYIYKSGGTGKLKCAIYKKSDNTLVGVTEEREGIAESWGWQPFNFVEPKPDLENIDYWLVLWSDSAFYIKVDIEADKGCYMLRTYDSFPYQPWDPFNPTLDRWKRSIYCSYSVPAPPAKPASIIPLMRLLDFI